MVTLSGILCLAVWLPSTTSNTLIVFACLYGFVSGIFISVMPAATAQITPTEKLGARLGAFGTVTSVAFLTGSPTAGALIKGQTREGYQPLIAFAVCSNRTPIRKCGEREREREKGKVGGGAITQLFCV